MGQVRTPLTHGEGCSTGATNWLCLSLLAMCGGTWFLGMLLCLRSLLEPMFGSHFNHMGP